MNARLALHAARRMAHGSVILALALAGFVALQGGEASALADASGLRDPAAGSGTWIGSAWTAFLVLVAPFVVWRAASLRSRGEVAWVAVSRTGVARSEVARALGAGLAIAGILGVFSVFVALASSSAGPIRAFVGEADGPTRALVDHDAPLAWSASVPEATRFASIDISLSIAAGSGGEVRFRASRRADPTTTREGSARVLPRGTVEVEVPTGTGDVDFVLSLPEPGARGFVTSEHVPLWHVAGANTARDRLGARIAIALLAWSLLAFGLAAWLAPSLACATVAAGALAIALGDFAPAWIPGAMLATSLGVATDGRAPAPVGPLEIAGLALVAVLASALARRGAEGRP